ncbi:GrpB family protein [Aquimarina aquimarini]|uniref:GrpB family protein n=1 Tax=Aquimarina aquimarini TaxID=1191734 RepID=UPI000D56225E|nr:GrpB family protein [Aquimarina aquimarini]
MNVINKKLEELTIEEWGELFPIEMISYQETWASVFQKEKHLIEEKLSKATAIDIQHIGSTSISGLASKGSIDMLIDIPSQLLFDTSIIQAMQTLDYEYCIQSGYGPNYMIFAKGFDRKGKTDFVMKITKLAKQKIKATR